MIWKAIRNPRKENGDLGDLECSLCECQTGAYVELDDELYICKGCLLDAVAEIDKAILTFE
jgi:hypothetical protein